MEALFAAQPRLCDVHQTVFRNIVSIRQSQDLFDDLSDAPANWQLAQQVEDAVKPPPYQSHTPIIHRPFEDAHWAHAIDWPFKHWQHSRFSDGSFGVWYGCAAVDTSVYETAYHWVSGFLRDAGFERESILAERKVYEVHCDAALLDFRPLSSDYPGLLHPSDYGYTQAIGARLQREGHPGLITCSARHPGGQNYAVFNAAVLSAPQTHCLLSYQLADGVITVEKQAGKPWLKIDTKTF